MPRRTLDPLAAWLALDWSHPERSYNPDLKQFLMGLWGYRAAQVQVEIQGPGGYPDLTLFTEEEAAWIRGDLKKDDAWVTDREQRYALWRDKVKYASGLTRLLLFVTPHYLWLVDPAYEEPWVAPDDVPPASGAWNVLVDLRRVNLADLREQLAVWSGAGARHDQLWQTFLAGSLPYSYLSAGTADGAERLSADLQESFAYLSAHVLVALDHLADAYQAYQAALDALAARSYKPEAERRARRRLERQYALARRIFEQTLPLFHDLYGRELDHQQPNDRRIREAFALDSVAVLITRVLFLRLLEDTGLSPVRRLSNGGPRRWAAFVQTLADHAQDLVDVAYRDAAASVPSLLSSEFFEWVRAIDGAVDRALQDLILRLNAYNFADLSAEILGTIYQSFLPPAKRKQLGEFYTPTSIVDWLLSATVERHGPGPILDPSSGSGSFLVRYVHRALEGAARRGLDLADYVHLLHQQVTGFDLNPFAAFVTHFQLLWAFLRYGRQALAAPPRVFNLNSLESDADILAGSSQAVDLHDGSMERDTAHWRYVVGNPPYIRAERIKYGAEMRALWSAVWGQNADTGLVFLYRALTQWLDRDGWLGMVVSGGYASSDAARSVWNLLRPGQQAALREVVWLEFAPDIWEPNVIPLLLVAQKTPAHADDVVRVTVPASWPSAESGVTHDLRYADLFAGAGASTVLLPVLLQPGDVALADRMTPGNGGAWRPLGVVVAWTYGIQRGGAATYPDASDQGLAVLTGSDLASGWHQPSSQYVRMAEVRERHYGKPSLWRVTPQEATWSYVAVPTLVLGPTAAVVSNGNTVGALNTVIVGRADLPDARAIAAYVNSSLVRWYWAVRLRSAIIQQGWSTLYPRLLAQLPWPRVLPDGDRDRLAAQYVAVERAAQACLDSPDAWLLHSLDTASDGIPLRDARWGLTFLPEWHDQPLAALTIRENTWYDGLFPVARFRDDTVAAFVRTWLELTLAADARVNKRMLQQLPLPDDVDTLWAEYQARQAAFAGVREAFFTAVKGLDTVVYDVFGITPEEQAHIAQRLATFPLNRLVPRYPWEVGHRRPAQQYLEDRFRS